MYIWLKKLVSEQRTKAERLPELIRIREQMQKQVIKIQVIFILSSLLEITPLFTVIPLQAGHLGSMAGLGVLQRYGVLISTLVIWLALRWLVNYLSNSTTSEKPDQKQKSKTVSKKRWIIRAGYILLFAAAIALMLSLQAVKLNFSTEFFYCVLTAIALDALATALIRKQINVTAIILRTIAYTIIGYLSFQLQTFRWEWQSAVYSLGSNGMLGAILATRLLIMHPKHPQKSEQSDFPLPAKLIIALSFLGPVCITCLAFGSELSKYYVASCFCILLTVKIAQKLQETPYTYSPSRMLLLNIANYALYLGMIVWVGLA